MIVAALAPLLLVSLAQSPSSDYEPVPAPSYQQENDVVGQPDPYEAAEEAAEEADEAAAEAVEDAADAAEAEAEQADDQSAREEQEYEAEVCRRVHYVDDFGRQRSRKSCRPR